MSQPVGITITGSARLGDTPLFAPVTLPIAAGGWTCLLGASGVGKSTLLRLIAGLDTGVDFSGAVTADDTQPLDGRVAFMAQNSLLLPWATVLENVTIGARLRGERPDPARAERLLVRVGLADQARKKPGALSGGQHQRVALARTLMEDRPVVLLDEPFSALDAQTRAEMQDLAHDLLQGRTVLLVTHDPAEAARLADRLFILTPQALTPVPVPPSPAPRPVDDPETLTAQGQLFRQLRGAA